MLDFCRHFAAGTVVYEDPRTVPPHVGFLPMSRHWWFFVVALLCCAQLAAAAPATSDLNDRLATLVEQLGDAEFQQREEAERELRKLGVPALDALLDARESNLDIEVRRRAERLVPEIESAAHAERLRLFLADTRKDVEQTVPGWKRFKALVGDTIESRRWFVAMHQAEPTLMIRADDRGERVSATIGDRLAELMRPAFRGRTSAVYQLGLPAITAILFVGSREDISINEQLATQMAQIAQGPAVSNLLLNSTGEDLQRLSMTKILSAWIAARSQGWTAISNLHLAQRFQLRESGLKVCRELLGRQGLQATIRGQALLGIERFGSKDDVAVVEACFDDKGACLNFVQQTKRLTVEVREVALVVAALLTGDKPADYGCADLQRVNNQQLLLNSLDLGDNAKIEEALEKWKNRQAEKKS